MKAPVRLALFMLLLAGFPAPEVRAADAAPATAPAPTPLVVELPKSVEDSVLQSLSEMQSLLIRETNMDPASQPQDHPAAWPKAVRALDLTLSHSDDSIFDRMMAYSFFGQRGTPVGSVRMGRGLYPVAVVFYNSSRMDETYTLLYDRTASGERVYLPIHPEQPCCWHPTALQSWQEGGHTFTVLTLEAVGTGRSEFAHQIYEKKGDRWEWRRTQMGSALAPRSTSALVEFQPPAPRIEVLAPDTSRVFMNPPFLPLTVRSRIYELSADSSRLLSEKLHDSFLSPGAWAMECFARRHPEWARPYAADTTVLHQMSRWPWDRLRTGWKFESASRSLDTLNISHPALGRVTLYSRIIGRRKLFTGFHVDPLKRGR